MWPVVLRISQIMQEESSGVPRALRLRWLTTRVVRFGKKRSSVRRKGMRFAKKRNSIWRRGRERKGKEKKRKRNEKKRIRLFVGLGADCWEVAVLFTFSYIKTRRCDLLWFAFLFFFLVILSPHSHFPLVL